MLCPECKKNCSTYREGLRLLSYCCETVIADDGIFFDDDLFLLYEDEDDLLPNNELGLSH